MASTLHLRDDGPPGLALGSAVGRWVVSATILASTLASIDGTVVTLALPALGSDLGATFADLQWVITGYTLTLASLILLGGAAADRIGRRRMLVLGTIWFTAASVLCAAAPSVGILVGGRILQGMGGALLTPASLAVLEAVFRPDDRAAAIGTWAGFSGVAGALSPFIGGWVLQLASWRWVFLINVPVAIVVVALAQRHVPESSDGELTGRRLDWWGALAATVALASLTYLLSGAWRVFDWTALPWLLTAITFAASLVFLVVEHERRTPLLPLKLFRIRQFSAANGTTLVVYGAIGVFFFLFVLQLQVVLGWSPLSAGASIIPVTVITLILSRWSGRIAQRIGPRVQMSAGPVVCAAGVMLARDVTYGAHYVADVLPAVVVFGVGLATMVAPLTAAALSAVSASHAGVASGFNNAVARTGALLAIAAIPPLAGITGDAISDPGQFAGGYGIAMTVSAALLLLGAVIAAFGMPARGTTPFGVAEESRLTAAAVARRKRKRRSVA